MLGTPKNLHQAIRNGMAAHTGGSVENWKNEHAEHIRLHVKDFLAQKFQAAKCLAHQGNFSTEDDLQLLFDACVAGIDEQAKVIFSVKGIKRDRK